MTDKQHDTRQDTQKAAGELQGAHTEDRTGQDTGTGTQQETHGSHGTHSRSRHREDKRREGRKGGERDTDGLAPGEQRRRTERSTAAEREQGENGQTEKKEIYKYLRERREKNAAETRKHM